MPYIQHQRGQTFYQTRGRKNAPGFPIICLHGGPGGHSRHMAQLFGLANTRKVFIYDQVGGGRSSPLPTKQYTIKTFVTELQQLREAWGLDQFHLFGASWGTTLALEYYLGTKNHGVRSLTFQSPMFSAADWQRDANKLIRLMTPEQQKVIRYCHEIGATDSEVYQKAMMDYYAEHVCRNKNALKRSADIKNPNGNKIYAQMWGPSEFKATGTLKHYDRTRSLTDIDVPTLIICGEHDEARPQTGRRYAKMINGANFSEIKDASHSILREKPKVLINEIGAFISRYD